MPIKPPSQTYTCPSCGWKKTVSPRSDALMPWEAPPERCAVCGADQLKESNATFFERAVENIAKIVR